MWFPFYRAKKTAMITCCHVIENQRDVLYVSHDADDGMWQFLCGGTHRQEEARVVSMKEIVHIDPTVSELADMPRGYVAERNSKDTRWVVKIR